MRAIASSPTNGLLAPARRRESRKTRIRTNSLPKFGGDLRTSSMVENTHRHAVVRTRHVLAVPELQKEKDYYIDKLGFVEDFPAPGWAFLSLGDFKVMLGGCPDDAKARDTGCHSWYAHVIVEDVNSLYADVKARGAKILS